jgi:hypothetical protein
VRTYHLSPGALGAAEGWLVEQRSTWERRLDQLDRYLVELKKQSDPGRSKR